MSLPMCEKLNCDNAARHESYCGSLCSSCFYDWVDNKQEWSFVYDDLLKTFELFGIDKELFGIDKDPLIAFKINVCIDLVFEAKENEWLDVPY